MVELFVKDKYMTDAYSFTAVRDPRLKKDKPYYIQKCEAIYSPYVRDLCSIPATAGEEMSFLRAFGSGDQPESRYRKIVKRAVQEITAMGDKVVFDTEEAKRKGYYNTLWTVVSRAPLIRSNLIGLFQGADFKVQATPTDRTSKNNMEDAEMELWAITKNKDFLKDFDKSAGIKTDSPDFMPDSQDEMDVYRDTGGFKPNFARVMEKCMKTTDDESDWQEIKKLMNGDVVDLNVRACKDYYDPEENIIKTKWLDPQNTIIQWSQYPDHHDSEYAGHLDVMNISELRQWIPDKPESYYRNIAWNACGYAGNPAAMEFRNYKFQHSNGTYGYDFFKILYADFEWIDIDTKTEVLFDNKFGRQLSKEVDFGSDLKDFMPKQTDTGEISNKVLRFTDKRRLFTAKWIVGTDELFDWGPAYDQVKPTKKEVSLTYHVYLYRGKSIIKRLIPIFDQFQILWLKLQNAIAYMRNEGGLFNANAIMQFAKTPEERAKWTQGFLEAGYNFFLETQAMGMRNTSMQPFFPIPGGMGRTLPDIIAAFELNGKMVEEITGFNPLTLGTTPNADAPVTSQKISVASMNNTLKDFVSGYFTMRKQRSELVCRWIQICVKTNQYARKAYSDRVGDMDVKILEVAEGDGAKYGISLIPLPDDVQKENVYKNIDAGLKKNDMNQGGITVSDALILSGMIDGECTLKEIAFEFAIREKKNMKRQAEIAKANTEAQSKAIQDEKQKSHDLDKDMANTVHDHKMDELKQEGQNMRESRIGVAQVNKEAAENTAHIKTNKEKETANETTK
jgi:hypothetical protein